MNTLRSLLLALVIMVAGQVLLTSNAQAFCGFYVSGASDALYNDATQVVMMRHETQTVLSMRNTYQGPPEDFAMVVPVPQVLEKENVKVLPDSLFDKIERQSSPRLVEYWQQGRCRSRGVESHVKFSEKLSRRSSSDIDGLMSKTRPTVSVKARFEVGEYEIVILSATESNGLEAWLVENKYNIPKGAAKVLAAYIAQGQYFFVAKVDPDKVKFVDGRAVLSPLRFHYSSEEFSLPVRLGLLNAKGTQDLIVHTLGIKQRYQVANYKNITIPTNLVVPERTRKNFSDFYNGLFDYTMALNPRSVVTEYAWDSAKCDPCAGPTLDQGDLFLFGLDTLRPTIKTEERTSVTIIDITSTIGSQPKVEYQWHHKLQKKKRELLSCYNNYLATTSDKPSGKIAMSAKLTMAGRVEQVDFPWNSFQDKELTSCIESVVKTFVFDNRLEGSNQRYEVAFELAHDVYKVPLSIPQWGWTLTRLHARYPEKTMTEDLIFEKAPAIRGGVGMPTGERGTIALEGAELAGFNTFQGRYIILNYDKKKLSCKKEDRYYTWGGPPAGTRGIDDMWGVNSSVSATRKSAKLSGKIKAAAKRQYKAPE